MNAGFNDMNFSGHYVLWQINRLSRILEFVDPDWFNGKNVLELGCGYAFFGEQFSRLGANVLCVDGRKEHIDHVNMQLKRSGNNAILTRLADLNHDFSHLGVFDIILDMGLLYHLEKPEDHIACLANMMHDESILILETIVADFDAPLAYFIEEEGYDQSLTNRSRILSPVLIERNLEAFGLKYEDISSKELNASIHCYDWSCGNTRKIQSEEGIYFRKMWLVRKISQQANCLCEQSFLQQRIVDLEKLVAEIHTSQAILEDEKRKLLSDIQHLSIENDRYRHETLAKLENENTKLKQKLQKLQEENQRLNDDSRSKSLKRISRLVKKYEGNDFKVGIFGAGEHTEQLFRTTEISKLCPVAIFDNDRSKWALNYQNIPIKAPNTINKLGLDLVIISSQKYEKEIYCQLKKILDSKTLVSPLYGTY